MIGIKNTAVLRELLSARFHPQLVALVNWCAVHWPEFTITSGYRKGDPGVHGMDPCRGMDARSTWTDAPMAEGDKVNSVWQYDPERPEMKCCIYHDVGKGAHFHLQVHARTVFLDGVE